MRGNVQCPAAISSVYVYVESNEMGLSSQGQTGDQTCLKASHLREIVSNAGGGRCC